MIKIQLHKNIIYLLALFILKTLSVFDKGIIKTYFNLNTILFYIYVKILGQIIGGLILYIYHFISWRKKLEVKYFTLNLIHNNNKIKINDKSYKIILLLFFSSFFDFLHHFFDNLMLKLKGDISLSLTYRLGGLSLIFSSLLCFYALRFQIGKHQKFSLIALSICLFISIISDIIFMLNETNFGKFFIFLFYILIRYICETFTDCIERYLVDYNFLNHFKILMVEGVFEIIISFIFLLYENPFDYLINFPELDTKTYIFLLISLILYFLFSSAVSVYKIYCNVIFSPMTKSLMNYIMNPLWNIAFYFFVKDFYGKAFYLIVSEIICLIIDFFGCVYLEYIIIYSCGLEYDTKNEIYLRGLSKNISIENLLVDDDVEADNIKEIKDREMSIIESTDN